MTLLRRIKRWIQWLDAKLRGRELEYVVWRHELPPPNSKLEWSIGVGRCVHCLAHESDEAFDAPCPRKRPSTVELA